jgi:prolyl 4-hydroxylase
VLEEHVDRIQTHAVSAILQIDQEIDEPWGLTLLDHKGVTHWVYLLPGEMVYYESAKCLHGRPRPFVGKSFANVFVHYKPSEGWDYQ